MNKKVLVIDDDEILRYSMIRAFNRFELDLFEAGSVAEARQQMNNNSIDWVVLDLRLGLESGLEFAQWMLKNHKDVEIVIITGYASVSTAVEAIKLGVKNYLTKPVSIDEIIQAFESDEIDANKPIKDEPLSPKRLEWEHIQKVLLAHGGNVSQAARALKMHRRTLQRKLKKKPVKE